MESSINIPISNENLTSMRKKLLQHDRFFLKFLSSSKDTVSMKTTLQDLFTSYQTAFNSLVVGYSQVVQQLNTIEGCKTAVIKACAGITRNCVTTVREAAEKISSTHTNTISFSDKLKAPPKIRVPRGPTLAAPKSNTTFVVAPMANAVENFADFEATKTALINAINPVDVDLRVVRMMRASGNELRIEASTVNLDKLRSSTSLSQAGLEIKDDAKFNPRLIVSGVPVDMTKESIREDFINQNMGGEDNLDIKVVLIFRPFNDRQTTRCVLEVPPEVRIKLIEQKRIYLGFSSCTFDDHVRVRHCYKCLSFGHVANDCTATAHCGICSEDHEMKNCVNKDNIPCCYNCKANKFSETGHTATDGSKCPILKKRLTNKIHMTNYG